MGGQACGQRHDHGADLVGVLAAGQQASATAIAAALGIKPTAVLPLTAAVPVTGATGNDVVVIGTDLAAAAGT